MISPTKKNRMVIGQHKTRCRRHCPNLPNQHCFFSNDGTSVRLPRMKGFSFSKWLAVGLLLQSMLTFAPGIRTATELSDALPLPPGEKVALACALTFR
jgi:hypothetical protein